MPWNNFAHLSRPEVSGNEPGGRGPGKITRASVPTESGVRYLPTGLEIGTGEAVSQAPAEVTAFAQKQAAMVRRYEVNPTFWLPQWVRDYIDSGGSREGLIQQVVERVRANPNEPTLLEAQAIINELGRGAEGATLVRPNITKGFALDVAKRSQGGS